MSYQPLLARSRRQSQLPAEPPGLYECSYGKMKEQKERLEQARKALRNLRGRTGVVNVNEVYARAFFYKGRLVDEAPLLHIAIWLEAAEPEFAGVVKDLIQTGKNIDMNNGTWYSAHQGDVKVDAITVAAGMNAVSALTALTDHLGEQQVKNSQATFYKTLTTRGDYYYTPLHEACFRGRTEATLWLLKHGAQADRGNNAGVQPLVLFIASGDYDHPANVERTVKELVHYKACLGKKQITGPYKKRWWKTMTGDQSGEPEYIKISPLEVAVQHDVNFPKNLIPILAASIHGQGSFLDDLFTIRNKSHAAEELAERISVHVGEGDSAASMRQLTKDMQESGVRAKLLGLMIASPKAAAIFFDSLLRAPFVHDKARYPIRKRTSLKGLLANPTMRCLDMPDAPEKEGVLVPAWYASGPQWHDDLVPKVDDIQDASHAYDVNVTVLPVPNILGLDFIQALACLNSGKCCEVFARKAVQGIVSGMWDTLALRIYSVKIFVSFMDVGSLLIWGLFPGHDKRFSESPHIAASLVWLLGTCARECLELLSWFVGYREHRRSNPIVGLWRFTWLCCHSAFLAEVGLAGLLLWFLVEVSKSHESAEISQWAQALLALNLYTRCVKLMLMLRLIHGIGPALIAVYTSMLSGGMQSVLFIAAMSFVIFDMVFLVLRRDENQDSATLTTMYLYRDLIFADGDGLDRFGLAGGKNLTELGDEEQHQWSTFYGTLATLSFSIVILNLIIAIYSDEYKDQHKRAPKVFVLVRARFCAAAMLKYHALWRFITPDSTTTIWQVGCFFATVCILIVCFVLTHEFWLLVLIGFCVGIGFWFGTAEVAGLAALWHTTTLPAEPAPELQPQSLCLGAHPAAPTPRFRSSAIRVKDAKLCSPQCVEVKIRGSGPDVTRDEFQTLCEHATLVCGMVPLKPDAIDVAFETPSDNPEPSGFTFWSTLVFEDVNIWGPLRIRLGEHGEHEADVRLPRFLWLCCREGSED